MDDPRPSPSLDERVLATWRTAFPDLTDPVDEPGTSILTDPQASPTEWVSLWPVGRRVVTRVAPAVADQLRTLLHTCPSGHRLTADDITAGWPGRRIERERQHLHGLDPATFRPVDAVPGQQVRELAARDRDTSEAFLRNCAAEDREKGDVGIGGEHELTVGVLVDGHLRAAASVFEWRGFSDVGVLTDPRCRRRGHGTAVVSALIERLVEGPRVVTYRYVSTNRASAGVARSLRLPPVGVAESVRVVDAT
jgi:GNAT superfamily N-acetyltransferase